MSSAIDCHSVCTMILSVFYLLNGSAVICFLILLGYGKSNNVDSINQSLTDICMVYMGGKGDS